jgi:hypothetical protein
MNGKNAVMTAAGTAVFELNIKAKKVLLDKPTTVPKQMGIIAPADFGRIWLRIC